MTENVHWKSRDPDALTPLAAMEDAIREVGVQDNENLAEALLDALDTHGCRYVLVPVELLQDHLADPTRLDALVYLTDLAFPDPDLEQP